MHPNWNQIKQYLDLGMSLIPVREKDEKTPSGILKKAKAPFVNTWTECQTIPKTEPQLWHEMTEKYHTDSVALICGKISGNIEVIDVDVKYYPGIDAILFLDIQKLYPNIWDKLLINKTPSGGYHLIYKVSGEDVPGSKKLAGRLEAIPDSKKTKPINFIETRGEGGYIVVPPSEGYSHHLGTLNTLTWVERTSIIEICRSYTQIIKIVKPPKQPKEQGRTDYYEINPFDDYNQSDAATILLKEFNWTYFNSNSHSDYWTRPDRDGGISASFSHSLRTYYIFTTSTELDSLQGMSPSTLLAQMKFSGDYKALYQYLRSNGYGKINPSVETKIIDRRASDNRPVPANLSLQAKESLNVARAEYAIKYPFGIFWDISDEDGVSIDRMKLYRVCEGLRFYQYASEPVLISANLIYKQTIRQFYDALHGYVREEDADKNDLIRNAIDVFFEKHGKHALFMLAPLDTSLILSSRKKISYKFYRNGVLTINKDGYNLTDYTNEYLVWAHIILQRDFTPASLSEYNNYGVTGKGIYYDFLNKAIGLDAPDGQLNAYPLRCIGYLTHDYKDSEGGYLIVLTEMCKDPKQGGGAGKNIFSQLLSLTTSWHFIDGSTTKTDATLLQAWHFERIISITDVPRTFPYNQVKSKSDGQIQVKRLFKDIFNVPLHDNPKILISTNFSPDLSDGGLIRRVRIIEFTDFFTKSGGVNTHYGKMFPDGWDATEYNYYDNLVAYSIQLYLQDPLLLAPTLSIGGWQKQFEQEYGSTIFSFIDENINDWLGQTYITEAFTAIYERWCAANNIGIKYRLSMIKINRALEAYCSQHNIAFNKDARYGALGARGRQFGNAPAAQVAEQIIDEELPF